MPITDIYTLADDALQNLFDIEFTADEKVKVFADKVNLDLTKMRLRVTEVSIPEITVDTYELHYQGVKVIKPTPKANFGNEFSFSLRIDRDYRWYKFFEIWQEAILSIRTGERGIDTGNAVNQPGGDNFRANIRVFPDGLGTNDYWNFHDCFPKTIPAISLSNETSEPVVCEITFGCNYRSTLY